MAAGGGGVLTERLAAAAVPVIIIPELGRDIRPLNDIKSFFKLLSVFQREKPDVIHLNSSKIGGLGGLAGRIYNCGGFFAARRRAKIIFTVHGWTFREKLSLIKTAAVKFFSWLTIILAHQVIAVSESDRRAVEKFFLVGKKIITIHNGVGEIKFFSREEARKIIGEKIGAAETKDRFWIGAVAELHRNKDLPSLIRAMAIVGPKTVLVIIGEGEEKERLANLSKRLGLEKRVFLAGFIPNAACLLAAFDIFVLSSTKEGLPYVILEAGLAGVPVAATAVGGVTEIIDNGENGLLVKPENPKELAARIKELLADQERRELLGQKLRQKILNQFSLGGMIRTTIKCYR